MLMHYFVAMFMEQGSGSFWHQDFPVKIQMLFFTCSTTKVSLGVIPQIQRLCISPLNCHKVVYCTLR